MHRKKRIDVFFQLYTRYRNYGYTIVNNQLSKCGLLSSLGDERDAIVFEAINSSIIVFNEKKGTYKALFSKITTNITLQYITKFLKDPLSDYISLDDTRKIGDEMIFMDSVINIDTSNQDKELINKHELDVIKSYYKGHYQRRIKRMVEMRRDGFSFNEIGVRYQMSDKAVRAIFYRLKLRLKKENNKK